MQEGDTVRMLVNGGTQYDFIPIGSIGSIVNALPGDFFDVEFPQGLVTNAASFRFELATDPILTLNSDHLSSQTKAWLAAVRGQIRCAGGRVLLSGLMIGCTDDPGDLVPADLRACIEFGRVHRYAYVSFEEGAERNELLELHKFLQDARTQLQSLTTA